MEILDLRHFSSLDLRPLLDEEIRAWAEHLSWDYSGSAEMILRYVDAKILPGYAAVDRGRVFGYAFFVYEGSKGVVGDVYVGQSGRSEDRGQVETQLLTHVIETLQQSPGIRRVEAQLLLHRSGGVAQPFLSQRFRRHTRLFMVLPLAGEPAATVPPPLRPPGEVEIRSWSEQEYQASAAVILSTYRGHVDAEINDQYRTLAGSLRFLNNIVRFPGCGTFDPQSSFVAIDQRTRNLVGLILCSRVRKDVGHVTQICVLPGYQSAGIGENLLAATVNNLRERRFALLSLTVTEANRRAVELYHRLQFKTARVFDAFVWEG